MRYPRTATLIAMLALAMLAMVPTARAQNTVGTITQIQGVANIQRGAQNLVVVTNMPVLLHDRIVTQPGASLTIGLLDNSSLQLGSSATLSIDESVLINGVGAPSKVGLLGGKLHSLIVGAMRGSTTTFEVHTPNAIGAVRGTEWDTDYEEGNTRGDKYKDCRRFTDFDVQDGTVQVCNTDTPPDCEECHVGHRCTFACGAFFLDGESAAAGAGAGGGLGLGAVVIGGVIVVGGVVGGLAAAGGFDGGGGGTPPPPGTPSK